MKAGLLGVAAAGLVAATAGSAPAQFVAGGGMYTAPRVSVGVGFTNGGFGFGGFYSTVPAYGFYRPVVVQPAVGWGGYWPVYNRPFYGGYSGWHRPYYGHPHGHHHRW